MFCVGADKGIFFIGLNRGRVYNRILYVEETFVTVHYYTYLFFLTNIEITCYRSYNKQRSDKQEAEDAIDRVAGEQSMMPIQRPQSAKK